MEKIVEVANLTKSYGAVRAVQDVSFYVEKGKFFAFLGPNGAGKSTTIDILCTVLKPDGGSVTVNGYALGRDDSQIRRSIGLVFQDGLLDKRLTVRENLMARGSLYGLSAAQLRAAIDRVTAATGIEEFIRRQYGKLSGGQRRRADIARALLHTPRVLFLDEPTTGLDPQTRKAIWRTIRDLQAANDTTVFLTTHYMEEAADADYVMVIDGGKIAARGTPDTLRQTYSADTLRMRAKDPEKLRAMLGAIGVEAVFTGDLAVARLKSTVDSVPILAKVGSELSHVEVLAGTMDDAFIGITGKEIRE